MTPPPRARARMQVGGWFLLAVLAVACSDDASQGTPAADTRETGGDQSAESTDIDDTAAVDSVEPPDVSVTDAVETDATEAVDDAQAEVDAEVAAEVVVEVAAEVAEEVSACSVCADERRPVILVHGINGAPENYDVMAARFIADGWPEDWVVRFKAVDPAWGCNVDNAAAIAKLVDETRARTCQPRVDVVAHSMGTLSSRYYVKNLGGTEFVNTYVTLGGMHHGLLSPCFAPEFLGICVWQELCQSGAYIAQLNADPATPGELHWVSIYGTGDKTVPNASSHLEGAENIVIDGAEHDGANGLLQREDVYAEVLRVLGYTCW